MVRKWQWSDFANDLSIIIRAHQLWRALSSPSLFHFWPVKDFGNGTTDPSRLWSKGQQWIFFQSHKPSANQLVDGQTRIQSLQKQSADAIVRSVLLLLSFFSIRVDIDRWLEFDWVDSHPNLFDTHRFRLFPKETNERIFSFIFVFSGNSVGLASRKSVEQRFGRIERNASGRVHSRENYRPRSEFVRGPMSNHRQSNDREETEELLLKAFGSQWLNAETITNSGSRRRTRTRGQTHRSFSLRRLNNQSFLPSFSASSQQQLECFFKVETNRFCFRRRKSFVEKWFRWRDISFACRSTRRAASKDDPFLHRDLPTISSPSDNLSLSPSTNEDIQQVLHASPPPPMLRRVHRHSTVLAWSFRVVMRRSMCFVHFDRRDWWKISTDDVVKSCWWVPFVLRILKTCQGRRRSDVFSILTSTRVDWAGRNEKWEIFVHSRCWTPISFSLIIEQMIYSTIHWRHFSRWWTRGFLFLALRRRNGWRRKEIFGWWPNWSQIDRWERDELFETNFSSILSSRLVHRIFSPTDFDQFVQRATIPPLGWHLFDENVRHFSSSSSLFAQLDDRRPISPLQLVHCATWKSRSSRRKVSLFVSFLFKVGFLVEMLFFVSNRRRTAKFLHLSLRHFPDDFTSKTFLYALHRMQGEIEEILLDRLVGGNLCDLQSRSSVRLRCWRMWRRDWTNNSIDSLERSLLNASSESRSTMKSFCLRRSRRTSSRRISSAASLGSWRSFRRRCRSRLSFGFSASLRWHSSFDLLFINAKTFFDVTIVCRSSARAHFPSEGEVENGEEPRRRISFRLDRRNRSTRISSSRISRVERSNLLCLRLRLSLSARHIRRFFPSVPSPLDDGLVLSKCLSIDPFRSNRFASARSSVKGNEGEGLVHRTSSSFSFVAVNSPSLNNPTEHLFHVFVDSLSLSILSMRPKRHSFVFSSNFLVKSAMNSLSWCSSIVFPRIFVSSARWVDVGPSIALHSHWNGSENLLLQFNDFSQQLNDLQSPSFHRFLLQTSKQVLLPLHSSLLFSSLLWSFLFSWDRSSMNSFIRVSFHVHWPEASLWKIGSTPLPSHHLAVPFAFPLFSFDVILSKTFSMPHFSAFFLFSINIRTTSIQLPLTTAKSLSVTFDSNRNGSTSQWPANSNSRATRFGQRSSPMSTTDRNDWHGRDRWTGFDWIHRQTRLVSANWSWKWSETMWIVAKASTSYRLLVQLNCPPSRDIFFSRSPPKRHFHLTMFRLVRRGMSHSAILSAQSNLEGNRSTCKTNRFRSNVEGATNGSRSTSNSDRFAAIESTHSLHRHP